MNKEKTSMIVFGFFICYALFVSYGVISNVIKKSDYVTLENNTDYEETMKSNKERLGVLDKVEMDTTRKECISDLNDLIDESLSMYVTGEVDLNKYILELNDISKDTSFLSVYSKIIKSCNLTDEDKKVTNTYVLNSLYYTNTTYNKALFNYEITFVDKIIREIVESDVTVIGYKSTMIDQSLAIKYIIDKLEADYE